MVLHLNHPESAKDHYRLGAPRDGSVILGVSFPYLHGLKASYKNLADQRGARADYKWFSQKNVMHFKIGTSRVMVGISVSCFGNDLGHQETIRNQPTAAVDHLRFAFLFTTATCATGEATWLRHGMFGGKRQCQVAKVHGKGHEENDIVPWAMMMNADYYTWALSDEVTEQLRKTQANFSAFPAETSSNHVYSMFLWSNVWDVT